MRGLGWGVGHAGLKLRAKKNPGQAGVGQGRSSMRRKEKELGRLGEFGPRGFEFKQNIFYNWFNSWFESNSNSIQSLNEFYTYSNSKHPRIQNKMQAAWNAINKYL
jgi:hypothetical protein